MKFSRYFSEITGTLEIYINNILHLRILMSKLVCIRSWYISEEKDPDPYFIELTFENTKVLLQYDSFEKGFEILKLLA